MSQSDIKTNDSLTVIPTKHLSLMIKDLEQGDKCSKKLVLVQNNLQLCESKNMKLDSLLMIADTKESLYKENLTSYQSIISTKDTQIQKLKKSKTFIVIGGVVVTILSVIF
jgi:hypothetical protein